MNTFSLKTCLLLFVPFASCNICMCIILKFSVENVLFLLHFIFQVDIQESDVAEIEEEKDLKNVASDERDRDELLKNDKHLIQNDLIPDSKKQNVYIDDDRDDSQVECEDRQSSSIRHVITVGPEQWNHIKPTYKGDRLVLNSNWRDYILTVLNRNAIVSLHLEGIM